MDDDFWAMIGSLLLLELGFGSGQTCWRRLGRWQEAGVFGQLHAAGELDWSRACVQGIRQQTQPPRAAP